MPPYASPPLTLRHLLYPACLFLFSCIDADPDLLIYAPAPGSPHGRRSTLPARLHRPLKPAGPPLHCTRAAQSDARGCTRAEARVWKWHVGDAAAAPCKCIVTTSY
ncbi:MAG: hypothetical protein J3K34DRAFT_442527, partial [Monoraphidium minutum]